MPALESLALLGAGMAAGTINAVAGAGSLVTFPTLLAFGYDPVVANVTNTVGIVPGAMSGAVGYRRELVGQAGRMKVLGAASAAGGLAGAVLLLVLPGSVFRRVVPVLILVACVLVAIQPRVARRTAARAADSPGPDHGGPRLILGVFATGVYGGYFGAAQGVILIALLGMFISDRLQRLNALKNVLAALVNGLAALLFIAVADVAWPAALALAAGAITGGQIGARVGRRVPDAVLRTVIIVVGTIVALRLLLS